MKVSQALEILGVNENASEKEIKKAYHKLVGEYHPDKNSSPEAVSKMKEINEAYSALTKEKEATDFAQSFWSKVNPDFVNELINIDLNGFFHKEYHVSRARPPCKASVTVSFEESVKGCAKDVTLNREQACHTCKGIGSIQQGGNCEFCDGKGRKEFNRQGNAINILLCEHCQGRGKKMKICEDCQGRKGKSNTVVLKVSIPAGITSGVTLRLMGQGHFIDAKNNDAAFISVNVTPHAEMRLDGQNVVSTVGIDLLEGIAGCTKKVNTVYGEKELTIPPKSRHGDTVPLANCGVNGSNFHRFILDVSYPEDTSKLIEALKGE